MTKKLVLLFVLLYFCEISVYSQSPKYGNNSIMDTIHKYIKKELLSREGYKEMKDSLTFGDSNIEMAFDISSVCEDLIKQEYVNNFSYSNSELKFKYKDLIERIRDSLNKVNIQVNDICSIRKSLKENIPSINRNEKQIILFYSKKCHNMIYVKAIPAFGIVTFNNNYEFYGEAVTYLFLLDEKSHISKIYTGEILYN